MKLRWIEHEEFVPTPQYGENVGRKETVKVLQYLDVVPNRFGEDTWVDVPTVKDNSNGF